MIFRVHITMRVLAESQEEARAKVQAMLYQYPYDTYRYEFYDITKIVQESV